MDAITMKTLMDCTRALPYWVLERVKRQDLSALVEDAALLGDMPTTKQCYRPEQEEIDTLDTYGWSWDSPFSVHDLRCAIQVAGWEKIRDMGLSLGNPDLTPDLTPEELEWLVDHDYAERWDSRVYPDTDWDAIEELLLENRPLACKMFQLKMDEEYPKLYKEWTE